MNMEEKLQVFFSFSENSFMYTEQYTKKWYKYIMLKFSYIAGFTRPNGNGLFFEYFSDTISTSFL